MAAAAQLQIWRLQKIALMGAVVTGVACTYFFNGIQRKITEGSYYQNALDAVRQNDEAMELLGGDFRPKWVALREPFNVVNAKISQLKVPVKGKAVNGTIEFRAACDTPGSNQWKMEYVALSTNESPPKTVNVVGHPPAET